jgi:ankyrin repeat protein
VALIMPAVPTAAELSPEPLFRAIRASNIVQIRQALDRGITARAVDGDGTPALMTATLFGDAAVVKILLDRGADPNAANKAGATALMWAIPELAKVKLLVARGANVNARSADLRRTPLLIAAGYPNTVNVLRVLVSKGADIRAKDREGMHALGRAVLHADVENVRFLVENGSDIADRSGFGEYGLGLYFVRADLQIAEYLLSQGVKVDKEALAIARSAQSVSLLDRMLAAGADVNAPINVIKSTPLLMATAAEQTHPDALRWLLDKGADPNAEGINGDRALDWASYRADQTRIDLLKRYGAKPGASTRALSYPPPEGIKNASAALERSVRLLLSTAPTVFKARACITCHNQTLPMQVAAVARQKGVLIDNQLLELTLKQVLAVFKRLAEQSMQGDQLSDSPGLQVGYIMAALASQGYRADDTTAFLNHLVVSMQRANGSWLTGGVSRPPLEDSDVSTTAMAVRALTLYPMPGRTTSMQKSLHKARDWLVSVTAISAEERDMRLMGLAWTKAPSHIIRSAIDDVVRRQRPDGGWSQLDSLPTDAYATGMSLYALHEAGLSASDPVYRRGIEFLLNNQYANGAWLVKSRAYPVQPYFESGFPFGQHQWISAAGSSWASLAIAHTLPDENGSRP